jgi:hypothetical protein
MTTASTKAAGPWAVVTCVTATCTRCGARPENEGEGFEPYFSSVGQARELLPVDYGWRVAPVPVGPAEELLCSQCAARDDCARLGHQESTTGPTVMHDGRTLPRTTWCDRCGARLSVEGGILPAPDGYLAAVLASRAVTWDSAVLPAGEDIAEAARRVIARLSDDAAAARRADFPGAPPGRPAPDPAGDEAAARIIIAAATALLHAADADPAGG